MLKMVSDCCPCLAALEITELQDWLFALPFDLDCVLLPSMMLSIGHVCSSSTRFIYGIYLVLA